MGDPVQELEAEENIEQSFDASDPKAVNEARKKQGRSKKKERDILVALMSHKDGRTLMYNSVKCILEGNPVTAGDINATYYNLGQEHRARELFREIVRLTPPEFALMVEENKDA